MPGKKSPAKPATAHKPAKSEPAKKASARGAGAVYSKPELRERLKEKITAGDKGGQPGQWSARKAQLLASEYKKEGGDYKKAARTGEQKHLESWTKEKWQTEDGKKAQRGKTTARYLPAKAWDQLTPAQKKATDEKKKVGSHTGKQFIANTTAAKNARRKAKAKS